MDTAQTSCNVYQRKYEVMRLLYIDYGVRSTKSCIVFTEYKLLLNTKYSSLAANIMTINLTISHLIKRMTPPLSRPTSSSTIFHVFSMIPFCLSVSATGCFSLLIAVELSQIVCTASRDIVSLIDKLDCVGGLKCFGLRVPGATECCKIVSC